MAHIVGIHGIGQQFIGAHTLHRTWLPALRDGIAVARRVFPIKADSASTTDVDADAWDLRIAFYGDLFRPASGKALGEPPYEATDIESAVEVELLDLLWQETVRIEERPDAPPTKVRTPLVAQRALNRLCSSPFFAGIAERALIADLKQVRAFLCDATVKERVLDRVADTVEPDTRVMIGHSLGSVVAYEALCAHPEWPVRSLITLGSPLGIPRIVFDRLTPRPVSGRGVHPPSIRHWVNVADRGDPVALQKRLATGFGPGIKDELVHNGAKAHDATPYLTARETGRAIIAAFLD
ncbi:hypothetical protein BGM19_00065 [Streptomyces agglomeratus]|uniref:hypothetical protein n=1 Tax=Streptomyces agglomeratus TaxID=285458 RepID=UPI000852660B|nr:hypothetical protein [Streptomyces agglomeratus]OEJ56689.1 hypothetical protein BGM19_00065 [Streptomyces agglomeratus]